MRETLRNYLKEQATSNARSLSEEMEFRLEQSSRDDQLLGGEHNTALARLAAHALHLAEREMGKSWLHNEAMKEVARAAVNRALEIQLGKPLGLLAPPEAQEGQEAAHRLGNLVANAAANREAALELINQAAEALTLGRQLVAGEPEPPAKPRLPRPRARSSSLGPRLHARRDPSRGRQTAH
jgi:hypothetical protein